MHNFYDQNKDNLKDREPDQSDYSSRNGGGFPDFFNSAMRAALVISIGFVLQGLAISFFRMGVFSSFLYFLGLALVPYFIYTTTKSYFQTTVKGAVSYLSVVSFGFWSYLLSLIVAALVYYTAFSFMFRDPLFAESMSQSVEILKGISGDPLVASQMSEALASLTPKSMTLSTCGTFFFFGVVYVYIIGIFLKRSDEQSR